MTSTEVKMEVTLNDLPELPFELILSYLILEERIKARLVSKSWHVMFDFRVKSLCFSERPRPFIYRNSKLVSGVFARNFICSIRFDLFFPTFGQSILTNLQHLRICYVSLNSKNATIFAQTLNSFDQLKELGLFKLQAYFDLRAELELNLPMLESIQLESVSGIKSLTLDAPQLQNVKILSCELVSLWKGFWWMR